VTGPPPRRFAGLKQTLRAFRYRNYRLYFGGQGISLTGSWMQQWPWAGSSTA